MNFLEEYRLSDYQDYGPLGKKENIILVRNRNTGKICVKKTLDKSQKEIVEFRKLVQSDFFPVLEKVIETEKEYIMIESYVEGITLEEFMAGEPLSETQAVKIAIQICYALLEMHNYVPMLVYRDLKPENIMIVGENQVKLIDFDISRCYQKGKTRDTELFGTAEYAAPEQFGYFQTDNRTDIYALGVVLNYMLTTKFPIECIAKGTYEKVIRKCIELEPSKRYQNVEELLKEFPKNLLCDEEKSEQQKDSWALPGFRSRKLWNQIIAVLGYVMLFYIGFSIEFSDHGVPYTMVRQWISRIAFVISQLSAILVIFNYRGISKNQKFLFSQYKVIRVIAAIGIAFVFLVIGVIFSVIVEGIFKF